MDLFPKNLPARVLAEDLQKKFGGFGSLDIIVESPNPAQNIALVEKIALQLHTVPDIRYVEYKNEVEFFRNNQLLYINIEDLREVRRRIKTRIEQEIILRHPLLDQIIPYPQESFLVSPPLQWYDLKAKYEPYLRPYVGNEEQSILMVRVFPSFEITDHPKSLNLYKRIFSRVNQIEGITNVNVYYAGQVFENISQQRTLVSELKKSIWIGLLLVLALLWLYFWDQPLMPIFMIFILFIGITWTIAAATLMVGAVNLITIMLGLMLLGIGLDSIIHLLSRYGEERRKSLGPEVALEHVVLEMGPAITTSCFTTSATFFSLLLFKFTAFAQFGLIGGWGVLFSWVSVILMFPALLLTIQKFVKIPVFGPRIYNHKLFQEKPFYNWKLSFFCAILITLIVSVGGIMPKFDYDFNHYSFQSTSANNTKEVRQIFREQQESPAILYGDSAHIIKAVSYLEQRMQIDSYFPVAHIFTLRNLLPAQQEEKLRIIEDIQKLITPTVLEAADSTEKLALEQLIWAWDLRPLTLEDVPQALRRRLTLPNSAQAIAALYPSGNTQDGRFNRIFTQAVGTVNPGDSIVLHSTGHPILKAKLLDLTLPYMPRVLFFAFVLVMIILLLDLKNIIYVIMVMLPPTLGLFWTFGFMNLFHIHFTPFNLIVIPIVWGLSMDGSIHLLHRYLEEQKGSLHYVMRRTGRAVIIAVFTTIAGFSGFALSDHGGLRSAGITLCLGLFLCLLANLTLFPTLTGLLDLRRYKKGIKHETTI
jgi:uncharacterized protein